MGARTPTKKEKGQAFLAKDTPPTETRACREQKIAPTNFAAQWGEDKGRGKRV